MKTQEEIIKMLQDEDINLAAVIDAVIEVNGIIGVGLITLGENLNDYVISKISRKAVSNDESA
jgi:hypothetical protein